MAFQLTHAEEEVFITKVLFFIGSGLLLCLDVQR